MIEIDEKEAEQHVSGLLHAMHIISKPGMEDTPKRVVKMLEEVWQGERYSNEDIAEMYGKVFPCDTNDMVVVKDIEAFSYCEHHLALIYNMRISVAYLPEGCVIGLSKIARIVDMCCKRLQLQERIGHDIVDVMTRIVGPNVAVRIEANHSCMTARGIKKPSSKTVTYATSGAFEQDNEFSRFLAALR